MLNTREHNFIIRQHTLSTRFRTVTFDAHLSMRAMRARPRAMRRTSDAPHTPQGAVKKWFERERYTVDMGVHTARYRIL